MSDVKEKVFRVIPFNQHIVVVWLSELKAFDERNGENFQDLCGDSEASFLYNYSADENHFRWALALPDEWDDWLVYHESLHAAFRILEFCNVPISYDSNEMLAFTQGYIAEKVFEFYEAEAND